MVVAWIKGSKVLDLSKLQILVAWQFFFRRSKSGYKCIFSRSMEKIGINKKNFQLFCPEANRSLHPAANYISSRDDGIRRRER